MLVSTKKKIRSTAIVVALTALLLATCAAGTKQHATAFSQYQESAESDRENYEDCVADLGKDECSGLLEQARIEAINP